MISYLLWSFSIIALAGFHPQQDSRTWEETVLVDAGGSVSLPIDLCDAVTAIGAIGDGTTDLDFVIRDADGAIAYSNFELDDSFHTRLTRRSNTGCETWTLEIENLGATTNMLKIALEPTFAPGSPAPPPPPPPAPAPPPPSLPSCPGDPRCG